MWFWPCRCFSLYSNKHRLLIVYGGYSRLVFTGTFSFTCGSLTEGGVSYGKCVDLVLMDTRACAVVYLNGLWKHGCAVECLFMCLVMDASVQQDLTRIPLEKVESYFLILSAIEQNLAQAKKIQGEVSEVGYHPLRVKNKCRTLILMLQKGSNRETVLRKRFALWRSTEILMRQVLIIALTLRQLPPEF